MGNTRKNISYVQASLEDLNKVKNIIERTKIRWEDDKDFETVQTVINRDPDIEITQTKENEIRIECGNCSGHETDISKNISNIKIISQHIDWDMGCFYIYYYLKNNDIEKFIRCEFEFNDMNDIYDNALVICKNVKDLTEEEITVLLDEGIVLNKDGTYKFIENKRFMHMKITLGK